MERPPIEELKRWSHGDNSVNVDHITTRDVCDYALSLEKERDDAQAALSAAKEQVEVGLQISGSFFEALKPLNLTEIYVANPGQHVTDLIQERDDWKKLHTLGKANGLNRIAALEQQVREITEERDNARHQVDLYRKNISDMRESLYKSNAERADLRQQLSAATKTASELQIHSMDLARQLSEAQQREATAHSAIRVLLSHNHSTCDSIPCEYIAAAHRVVGIGTEKRTAPVCGEGEDAHCRRCGVLLPLHKLDCPVPYEEPPHPPAEGVARIEPTPFPWELENNHGTFFIYTREPDGERFLVAEVYRPEDAEFIMRAALQQKAGS